MTVEIRVVVVWVYNTMHCSLVGGYYITCLINDFSLLIKPREQVLMTIS